jgi:hypothetical protein
MNREISPALDFSCILFSPKDCSSPLNQFLSYISPSPPRTSSRGWRTWTRMFYPCHNIPCIETVTHGPSIQPPLLCQLPFPFRVDAFLPIVQYPRVSRGLIYVYSPHLLCIPLLVFRSLHPTPLHCRCKTMLAYPLIHPPVYILSHLVVRQRCMSTRAPLSPWE